MSKRRSRGTSAPRYGLHKPTNQAIVTIHGKMFYLGKFGSDESHEKYRRLITEVWNQPRKTTAIVEAPAVMSISALAVEYAKQAKRHYQKNGQPTSEFSVVQRVLKRLRSVYGSTDAKEFGPLRYQAFRRLFIDDGLARSSINHYCWHVRKMFQLGGRNQLVPMSLYRDLADVGNLLEGRSEARETDDVLPADEILVQATIEELHPILADMVRLQLLTGMRPGEVRNFRPCDVDRTSEVWIYKPPTHKNEHKKSRIAKIRLVPIGPRAQAILRPYLLRDHNAFCFAPVDANPTRAKNPRYSKDSYRRGITRAALRVKPYPENVKGNKALEAQWRSEHCWHPNQLRHAAATLARSKGGIETAQQMLGHTLSKTTEATYAEVDQSRAVEFARTYG